MNLPAAVTNSSYNSANQQLTFGAYAMLYDAAGNITNIVNGTTTNRLSWSARNQLTNITGTVSGRFQYDGLGRRIGRVLEGGAPSPPPVVRYLYDGLDAIVEKNAAGTPIARYVRGLAIDEPWQRSDLTLLAEGGVTNGLRAWWKFNEGTGTSAAESSGNGNTGTRTGGASWGSRDSTCLVPTEKV
jgi:YD repeat-containing protein